MRTAFKLTFGSVWGWLGILVGALSLINLGVTYFSVGIGPILTGTVDTYRAIFHTAFDAVFVWLPIFLPEWVFPNWAKDAVTLYVLFASAVIRSYSVSSDESNLLTILIGAATWPLVLFSSIALKLNPPRAPRRAPRRASRMQGESEVDLVREEALMRYRARLEKFTEQIEIVNLFIFNFVAVPVTAFIFVTISSGMPGG